MVVDFILKQTPSYRVATITRVGPWREDNLRSEFKELTRWARQEGVKPGRWIFTHRGADRWEACLEYSGPAKGTARIRLKTLPAGRVASVTFDPEVLADRVVYHGLQDWTRSRKKDGDIEAVAGSREVYSGDPWSDKDAWAHCEVQFLVR